MPNKGVLLALLLFANIAILLLINSLATISAPLAAELPDEIADDAPTGEDASRASSSFHLTLPFQIPILFPTEPTAPALPSNRVKPAPTDDPPKAPYIFPTPIYIPNYYFDVTPTPRSAPSPTRRR